MAGNKNSGSWSMKPFRDALRMELANAGDDHKALRMIASALIVKASEGDMQAIKELADRIDGKVPAPDREYDIRIDPAYANNGAWCEISFRPASPDCQTGK